MSFIKDDHSPGQLDVVRPAALRNTGREQNQHRVDVKPGVLLVTDLFTDESAHLWIQQVVVRHENNICLLIQ